MHACPCRDFSSIIGEAKNVLCSAVQRGKERGARGRGWRGEGEGSVHIKEQWQCFLFGGSTLNILPILRILGSWKLE